MKEEDYPDTPQVEFNGFTAIYDTGHYPVRGILSIKFTDGDGDIGLRDGDTFPPYIGEYANNFIIEYFEKRNGEFVKVDFQIPFSARIPVLNPDQPGKAIKGIIVDTIPMNPYPEYDTIRIDTYIIDRALHKSNTVSTPQIILRRP
jgi:hypothetical protein